SIARYQPKARVTTVDISPEALAVAGRNAARHGVTDRVTFLQGDLFAPLPAEARFDFIVSNPPYIPHDDIPQLPVGVRQFEPHRALDGGPDGFAVFGRIVDQARTFLKPGGYLILEIGSPQEQRARQCIEACPEYTLAPTIHDASGHPRV